MVLSNLKNASGQSITVAGYVNVKVQALGEGRYTPSDKSESKSHYYVPEKQLFEDDLQHQFFSEHVQSLAIIDA